MTAPPPGKKWHTREQSGIRLDREGRWWHDEELVEHPKIIEAFNRGLEPTEDGRFKLSFGWDWCFVEVEDAAYRVTAVDALEDGRVGLRLSDRTSEVLDPATVQLDPQEVLCCRVKEGRARARFTRDAQFEIGAWLQERDGVLSLRIGGVDYPVGAA